MSVLPLPVSLWSMIDAYLEQLFAAWAQSYVEIAGTSIVVAEQFDPDQVVLPFLLVRGYECELAEAEPVILDGEYHISNMRYAYEFVIMAAFDTVGEAKDFGANASTSLIDALRADPTLGGLQADNGEYVLHIELDGKEIFVRGIAGQQPQAGMYSGTAVVRIDIVTEV